jgi:hypothetical protein
LGVCLVTERSGVRFWITDDDGSMMSLFWIVIRQIAEIEAMVKNK